MNSEKNFYEKQGIITLKGFNPFFGHLKRIMDVVKEGKVIEFPGLEIIKQDFGHTETYKKTPNLYGISIGLDYMIWISSPTILNELYLTYNKYFDKNDNTKTVVELLTGDSIVFIESNQKWRDQRKSLSAAFYKEQLIKYIEIMKKCSQEQIEEIKQKYVKSNTPMDLIGETQRIYQKIILMCAFGVDLGNVELDFEENGKCSKQNIGKIITEVFGLLLFRPLLMHIFLLPFLTPYFLTKQERELKRNILRIRHLFEDIVNKRRIELTQPGFVDKGDLVSALLKDEQFKHDNKVIIDQCVTFFLAGTQTVTFGTSNMIMYLMQNPNLQKQIYDEYQKVIIQKYQGQVSYESISELIYYNYCFLESLRIEPPVQISSALNLLEDCKIENYNIKKGSLILVDILHLHWNPEEWIEPHKFIPERFDPASKYFLTPSGQKRNPQSYGPFLGGKRICLGKTFAEIVNKLVGPAMLTNFEFEFVKPEHYKQKPVNHIDMIKMNECFVYVKEKTIHQ